MFRQLTVGAVFAVAITAAAPSQAATTIIGFDNLTENYTAGAYYEGGYAITGNFCHSGTGACIKAVDSASSIDPDGISVVKASGAATTFTVSREDGGAFQFNSMEFGKLKSSGRTYSSTYEFNFTLDDADQTVVKRHFTFLHQNPTPIKSHLATFDGLGDIVSFTFRNQSDAGQFDNISLSNMSAVPEPASWAMMIAGFGLVGGALRRRNTVQLRMA